MHQYGSFLVGLVDFLPRQSGTFAVAVLLSACRTALHLLHRGVRFVVGVSVYLKSALGKATGRPFSVAQTCTGGDGCCVLAWWS